ncbi:hypothetical protein BDR04DRAFT_606869, partial [Suillus decipiens]
MACASKMIHAQRPTDDALSPLVAKIGEVCALMTESQESAMIPIYGQMARQTLECTDFIINYSEIKNFWKRVGKYVSEETSATIQNYNKVLNDLMQEFRDPTTRNISLYRMTGDLDPNDMVYAAGAGLDVSKCCLPGTRKEILSEIKSWVCDPGKHVPCVMWLSGDAYTGKSAIAHTITQWYKELGGLGACFCFDRTRGADCRHEKIFSTIARDLSDCDPFMRRALADAFHGDNTLRHTTNITKQWQELIVAPIKEAQEAFVSPLLIVIDGLNESGEPSSREQLLRLLAGKLNTSSSQPIPGNYRILITSRLLDDIHDALDAVPHVKHISLDDISTERDILLYFSSKLGGPGNVFNNEHFEKLVQKSGGQFEWARLACEYINGTPRVDKDPMVRFKRVLDGTPGEDTYPFDFIYRLILEDVIPKDDYGDFLRRFRSVMGQILASQEPLPMAALTVMRRHFPSVHDHHDDNVAQVIGSLDSFFTGTRDSQT